MVTVFVSYIPKKIDGELLDGIARDLPHYVAEALDAQLDGIPLTMRDVSVKVLEPSAHDYLRRDIEITIIAALGEGDHGVNMKKKGLALLTKMVQAKNPHGTGAIVTDISRIQMCCKF